MHTKSDVASAVDVIRIQIVGARNDVSTLAQQVLFHVVHSEIPETTLVAGLWNFELAPMFGDYAADVHAFAHYLKH